MIFEVSADVARIIAKQTSPPLLIGRLQVLAHADRFGLAHERFFVGLCAPRDMEQALRRIEDGLVARRP